MYPSEARNAFGALGRLPARAASAARSLSLACNVLTVIALSAVVHHGLNTRSVRYTPGVIVLFMLADFSTTNSQCGLKGQSRLPQIICAATSFHKGPLIFFALPKNA